MTWVKLDDRFHDHPKIVGLSSDAYRAFVGGLCYCSRHLTDGTIPLRAARVLASRKAADELVNAELWSVIASGVVVHDYLDYQPRRSEVEAARLQRSEAGKMGGHKSGEARRKRPASVSVPTKTKQT